MKIRKEIKIGLFALLVMVGLYWGINFLRGRDIFSLRNTYYAQYDKVGGLQKSSAVTARGVKIGVVSGIDYNPSLSDKVTITLSIDSKFNIPANSQARIYSSGIMEGKAIEIIIGDSPGHLRDHDTLHSYVDPGLLEVAGNELEALTHKLSQTADNATKLLATITSMLEENREGITDVITNTTQVTAALAAETQVLHKTLSNVEKFSGTLADNSDNIDAVMGNLRTFSASLTEIDLGRLDRSMEQLHALITEVRAGRGTLGKLVVDDSLYNSLAQASADLSLLLEDLKANPGRYVNVSVFGRKNK